MKKLLHIAILFQFLLIGCKEEEIKICTVPYGGTFRDTRSGFFIDNFDPRSINSEDLNRIFASTYEGLTAIDPKTLETIPRIAKSWKSDKTCTKFTFSIHQDVSFNYSQLLSNKTEKVTAKSIKECFDHLSDTNSTNFGYDDVKDVIVGSNESFEAKKKGLNKDISGIKVINDSTLEFSLTEPFCDFPSMLAGIHFSIYPVSILNGTIYPDSIIVGTGPFYLSFFDDISYQFTKNENYWRIDSNGCKLPYLDSLYFLYNSAEKGSFMNCIKLFMDNKVDIIRKINPRYITSLVNMEGFNQDQYFSVPRLANSSMIFNNASPPFNNANLRKAFAYAFDKEQYVDSLFQGENWYADYGLFPNSVNYGDTVFSLHYNPDRARFYLNEYKKERGNNNPIIVKMLAIGENDWYAKQYKYFIERELEVKIELQLVKNIPEYFDHVFRGDFQLTNYGLALVYPTLGGYLENYHSNTLSDTSKPIYTNVIRYKNSMFDHFLERAKQEKDLEERKQLYASAENILIEDAAKVPLYYTEESFYLSAELRNYSINNLDLIDYAILYKTNQSIKE